MILSKGHIRPGRVLEVVDEKVYTYEEIAEKMESFSTNGIPFGSP